MQSLWAFLPCSAFSLIPVVSSSLKLLLRRRRRRCRRSKAEAFEGIIKPRGTVKGKQQ